MPKKTSEFSISLAPPATVTISGTRVFEDEFIYNAFKKAQKDGKSEEQFFEEALRLGVYGLMEARIAAFLGRAQNELDGGLERLKFIFELQAEEQRGTAKGAVMEREIKDVLEEFVTQNNWKDEVTESGAALGSIEARKVGDVDVKVEGTDVRLTIESKFDKTVQLGDIVNLDKRGNKDAVGDAESTAHGQLLLSLANRQSQVALIVFDRNECHSDTRALKQDVVFYPELPGFVVRIDKDTADFAPLRLAYSIARQLALLGADKVSAEHLNIATKRMLRDLNEFKKIEGSLKKIKTGANSAIEGVAAIELVVSRVQTSVLRTQAILEKVLSGSVPSVEEWKVFAVEPGGVADA